MSEQIRPSQSNTARPHAADTSQTNQKLSGNTDAGETPTSQDAREHGTHFLQDDRTRARSLVARNNDITLRPTMSFPPDVSPYLAQAVVDGGVALVTSAGHGRINAMTVSFFAESSHLPVLLRVALAPQSLTHELVSDSGWFGLSVLRHGQEELALQCGTASGREFRKFERWKIRHHLSPHGVPLLRDALTTSECRVVTKVPLRDHTLFIGEVVASFTQTRQSFRDPLLVSELRTYVAAKGTDGRC